MASSHAATCRICSLDSVELPMKIFMYMLEGVGSHRAQEEDNDVMSKIPYSLIPVSRRDYVTRSAATARGGDRQMNDRRSIRGDPWMT